MRGGSRAPQQASHCLCVTGRWAAQSLRARGSTAPLLAGKAGRGVAGKGGGRGARDAAAAAHRLTVPGHAPYCLCEHGDGQVCVQRVHLCMGRARVCVERG